MIGSLTGVVRTGSGIHICLDVHGVGYLVAVTAPYDFSVGETTTLYTHLAVRENALDLYGFREEGDLHMFNALISLQKIGPKTALQILTQADTATLKKAIATQDPVFLTKMSGIGKKTAEKIVLELKDTFEHEDPTTPYEQSDADVVDALMALGYTHKDAREALLKIPQDITDTKKRITEALKIVSKK